MTANIYRCVIKTLALSCIGVALAGGVAQASVISADADIFNTNRYSIGFDSLPLYTRNPSYAAADGSALGNVSFAGVFDGQSVGDADTCGAIGCVLGSPTSGLSLDADSTAFITQDDAAANNPVLSGLPTFAGPISILFDVDQAGVGLTLGSALALGAERMTAFDREGNILATVENDALGYVFLGLASDDASASIAGIQIERTGRDGTGFDIDDLIFGGSDSITPIDTSPTPPPATVPAPSNPLFFSLGVLFAGLLAWRRRARLI